MMDEEPRRSGCASAKPEGHENFSSGRLWSSMTKMHSYTSSGTLFRNGTCESKKVGTYATGYSRRRAARGTIVSEVKFAGKVMEVGR